MREYDAAVWWLALSVGALLLREKNIRSKVPDLILVLIGMLFLYLGSRLG